MEKQLIKNNEPEKLYVNIDPDSPVQEIESLCMNCEQNGITRLLLTKIPFFKDVIIMSFSCEHCGFKNNECQSASSLADYGIKYELKIVNVRDLSRRVVKTEFAEMSIPYCGLEIPAKTQKSKLSTIEGFISTARDDMQNALDTGVYDGVDELIIEKIKETVQKLTDILEMKCLPVDFTITDPSGNSYVENPYAPSKDVYCKVSHFVRTNKQNEEMGYSLHNEKEGDKNIIGKNKNGEGSKLFEVYKSKSDISAHLMDMTKSIQDDEGTDAICIPDVCISCSKMGENRVCVVTIPFFKELIITCFSCNECYYKSTEIKGGGGISDKGKKITLNLTKPEDLNRDLFKSESSKITINKVGFESGVGSIGSMFTTVEGLLEKITDSIKNTPFSKGDSCEDQKNYDDFITKMEDLKDHDKFEPFTLEIDDIGGNSIIFSINHENPEDDKNLIIEEYDRDWEQNDELGINDMKTEDYEENFKKEQAMKNYAIKEMNPDEEDNE